MKIHSEFRYTESSGESGTPAVGSGVKVEEEVKVVSKATEGVAKETKKQRRSTSTEKEPGDGKKGAGMRCLSVCLSVSLSPSLSLKHVHSYVRTLFANLLLKQLKEENRDGWDRFQTLLSFWTITQSNCSFQRREKRK